MMVLLNWDNWVASGNDAGCGGVGNEIGGRGGADEPALAGNPWVMDLLMEEQPPPSCSGIKGKRSQCYVGSRTLTQFCECSATMEGSDQQLVRIDRAENGRTVDATPGASLLNQFHITGYSAAIKCNNIQPQDDIAHQVFNILNWYNICTKYIVNIVQ